MNYFVILATFSCVLFLNSSACCMVRLEQQIDHSDSLAVITQQDLAGTTADFERKLIQGAKDGVFYLEMSEECKRLVADARAFANSFYNTEELRKRAFQLPGLSGYLDHPEMQAESFYAERGIWREIFSERLNQFATAINALAQELLKKTLLLVAPHIPEDHLSAATGKIIDDNGQYHLSFHHYRPEKLQVGMNAHRDFGFVTLLSIDKRGLIAKLNGEWGSVLPKEQYFIVNFGTALQTLVNDSSKLNAVLHAVVQVDDQEGRSSFGLFANGEPESPLYKADEDGSLVQLYPKYMEYIAECFKKGYEQID